MSHLLGTDEADLWPEVYAARVGRSWPEEIKAVYPASMGRPDAPLVPGAAATPGLEGIVLKRPGSVVMPGRRSRDWLKVKMPGYRRQ